jgi:hypothetical protein
MGERCYVRAETSAGYVRQTRLWRVYFDRCIDARQIARLSPRLLSSDFS